MDASNRQRAVEKKTNDGNSSSSDMAGVVRGGTPRQWLIPDAEAKAARTRGDRTWSRRAVAAESVDERKKRNETKRTNRSKEQMDQPLLCTQNARSVHV